MVLLLKDKVHSQYQKYETNEVIDAEGFVFEENDGEYGEDRQRDNFLNDFQLPQVERSAVFTEADPVGRHLERVLKKRNTPTDENYANQP